MSSDWRSMTSLGDPGSSLAWVGFAAEFVHAVAISPISPLLGPSYIFCLLASLIRHSSVSWLQHAIWLVLFSNRAAVYLAAVLNSGREFSGLADFEPSWHSEEDIDMDSVTVWVIPVALTGTSFTTSTSLLTVLVRSTSVKSLMNTWYLDEFKVAMENYYD